MDPSIRAVTPDMHFDRGYQAYHEGRGIDDHHMNPRAPAIADWQAGWNAAQAQQLAGTLVGSTPP